MGYRIPKRFSLQRFGLMWLAIAGAVVLALLLTGLQLVTGVESGIATAPIIIAALYWAPRWYMRSSSELLVDKSGVRVGDVGVPWDSIAQLVVVEPARRVTNGEASVGVALRPDAPLPRAVASAHSDAVNARQVYGLVRTDKLDVDRLMATVGKLAPQVEVTRRQGQPDGAAVVTPAGTP